MHFESELKPMSHKKITRFDVLHKLIPILVFAIVVSFLAGCGALTEKKPEIRALIIPKFEIDEITGDSLGEAQLFYENYCKGCKEIEIPHLPKSSHFYFNDDNGVGILVTDVGKTVSSLSFSALLSSDMYEFSNTYIVSVGCCGGSVGETIFGDVVLVTAACDGDLGFYADSSDKEAGDPISWYPDTSLEICTHEFLNPELCENVYQMVKDRPLRTTEKSEKILVESFGKENLVHEKPMVLKGTSVTSDRYWKGYAGHATADYIAKYYNCPDPYMSTEMEEIAILSAADSFGMLDRVISLRVVVNMDKFLYFQTPENLWGRHGGFTDNLDEDSTETLDIFEPAMQNLYDVASIVIDDILDGAEQIKAQ